LRLLFLKKTHAKSARHFARWARGLFRRKNLMGGLAPASLAAVAVERHAGAVGMGARSNVAPSPPGVASRRHDWQAARANVTPLPSPGRSSRRRLVHLLDGAEAVFILSTVPRLCSSSRRCRGRVHPGAGAVKIGKRSPCVWPCRAARFGVVSRAASHLSAAWLAIGTAENEWRLGCADKYGGGIPVVLARRRRQNGRGLLRVVALPVGSMWRPAFTGRVHYRRAGQFFGIVRNNSKGVRPGLSAPGAA
jgi:hypothetical protein